MTSYKKLLKIYRDQSIRNQEPLSSNKKNPLQNNKIKNKNNNIV